MSEDKHPILNDYHPKEERLNIISHAVGFILSVAALVLLIVYSSLYGDAYHIVSFTIFGATMVVLYLASTLYHASKKPKSRMKLKIFDHAAIYLLIAGTYTPYSLVTLRGSWGWTVFGIVWGLAIVGIILKLYHTGRFKKLSTLSYIMMGWVAVIAAKPLYENLSSGALQLLVWGGAAYTAGAVFYSIKKLPFNHAIFHAFVLAGTACHFCSIFFYLI